MGNKSSKENKSKSIKSAPSSSAARQTKNYREETKNLLLIGCKGNGKSHTGNTILGQKVFSVTRRGGTEKSSLCSSRHVVDGVCRKLTVVDTPGVSQEMTESEFEELVRAVKIVPEGFDAICLVWNYESSDKGEDEVKKEVKVFQSLRRLFGAKLHKHLVILVTHAQQEDIPEFLEELPDNLKEITKQCQNRIFAIENKQNVTKQEALKKHIECTFNLSNKDKRYVTKDLCCQIPKGDKLSIVLVGKTGAGKSHTGNNITGAKQGEQGEFGVSDRPMSETCVCNSYTRQKEDREITVLDTPGVFDTGNVENICEELCRIVTFFPDGIHALIFVMKAGRFTNEEAESLELFKNMFGDKFIDYTLILFTGKDELKQSSEKEYLKDIPKGLKDTLRKCDNRHVFFDNVNKDETILREQLVKLIKLVDDNIDRKEGPYTDDFFEEGKKEMTKIVQDINNGTENTWRFVTKAMQATAREKALHQKYEATSLYRKFYDRIVAFMGKLRLSSQSD